MKKILSFLLSMMCLVCVIFAFVGCDADSSDNSSDTSTNSESNDTDSSSKVSYSDTYYLAKTKVTQATETVENEDGTTYIQNAKLTSSQKIGNYMFLQYNIGKITNCFVQSLATPFYNDGGLKSFTYEKSTLTSKTISNGISNSISTTDSVSVATSETNTSEWSISASVGYSVESSVGINVGIYETSSKITESLSLAAEYAQSTETTTSEEIAQSVTDTSCEDFSETTLQQIEEKATYEYDATNYETGYYYALALVADIDVYQVIAYNMLTSKFVSTYFATTITDSNTAIRLLASESISFNIEPEYQLYPITEIDVEQIELETEDEGQTVVVDLTSYYTYESADLTNFSHSYYDNSTGIFTAYGSLSGTTVTKYIFKGMYGMPDDKGRLIKTTINGFSICIFSEHDIEIYLENMSFISVDGYAGVYLDDRTESSDQVITITSNGLGNYIYGADGNYATSDGGTGSDGQAAVNIDNLIVNGESDLTLVGGNGGEGANGSGYIVTGYGTANRNGNAGGSGGNGGTAINANSLTINLTASLYCIGGAGGNGGDGGNGGGSDDNGTATAGSGGNGGTGGSGGNAICTDTLNVTSSIISITLTSGTGGNGGDGGNGGWGKNANTRDSGGDGGNGGNGGNSGYCVYSKTNNIFSVISLISGNGGAGGDGGNGGNAYRDSVSGSSTYIGDGGNGGDGGDCNILYTAISTSTYALVSAKSGDGGNGGTAGDGGTGVGAINYGIGGTGGSSGDIVLSLGVTAVSGNSGTTGTKAVAGAGGSGGESVSIS